MDHKNQSSLTRSNWKKNLKENKFWPPVARVDNVYGDKNLFCSCPSMDEFKEDAA